MNMNSYIEYDRAQGTLTSKIILCSPKQKVDPKGLVLLAEDDLPIERTLDEITTHSSFLSEGRLLSY